MKPIILSDNRFTDGAISATGVLDDTRLHVTDLRPYTWLQFPAGGTNYLTVDCGAVKGADCLGIIGHNLASALAAVSVESSVDGIAWTTRRGAFNPASDRAQMRTFTRAFARYWRIKIVTAVTAPRLAVVMLGLRMDFPQAPESGFAPYSEGMEVDTNDSKIGNPLGSTVRFFPIDIKPSFSQIARDWVENTYRPFRENYSRYRKFFFWSWDLETYPEQILYLQDVGKFAPTVSRLPYYDKLALEFKGVMEP